MTFVLVLCLVALLVAGVAWGRERARHRATRAALARETESWRTRQAAELHAQATRTAALFDRMVEGVIVTDSAGRVQLANRAAGELFGLALPATGRTLLEATRHHEVAAVAARLEREPEVLGHEIVLASATAPRRLQINALALRDAAGGRDGAILVFHDLTQLRRMEAVRQEFVANVSHELRTPLSLIKGAAESLIDGGKNDPVVLERFLGIIDRHANRLGLLIEDLLLLSAADSGRMQLDLRPVPLRPAVQEVMGELGGRAQARGIVLENAVAEGTVVHADAQRLHQVLTNLLDNAIKYGRTGGRTKVVARMLEEAGWEVAVSDDGPGLPPEARPRVFERFYRVDKARSREQGGTGLGLAIVKHVVLAHGGSVRVESELGSGATFFFTLPAAPRAAD